MKMATDGRDARWAEHRVERRRELVESTLRAIRKYGAGVGMDEIAAEATTSKTVLYRHFGDRAGVYVAVVEKVAENILASLDAASGWVDRGDLGELVREIADAYLGLVERDPEIYRFVMNRPMVDRPLSDDPVTGLTNHLGDQVAVVLQRHGYDADTAVTLGYGLVGFVRAAAAQWIGDPTRTRDEVVTDISAFFAAAFAARSLDV